MVRPLWHISAVTAHNWQAAEIKILSDLTNSWWSLAIFTIVF